MLTTVLLLMILAQAALLLYLLNALLGLRWRIRRHLVLLARWRAQRAPGALWLPSNERLITELRAGRMQQRAQLARLRRIRRHRGRCQGGDA